MALTRLVADEEAQAAHAFVVDVMNDRIDTRATGFSYRLKAADTILRHYQTQLRLPQDRIAELAAMEKPSADVRDYANMTDEELEAKVASIVNFPRKTA